MYPLPFRISGGVRPYESSIDGCPDWVTLFPDQGILAGTAPAVDSGKTFFCTFRVTESDPAFRPARSVSYGLRLTVGSSTPVVSLSLPFPSKISLTVGTFHSEAVPAASGGIEPYTYSFTCAGGALPSGMGFAPATRMFAGTPDARFRDSCTLTVTDSSQPAATASRAVEVEVTGGVTPPLTLPPFPSKVSLTVGTFHSEALPAASGGVEPYTYSFTCAGGALPSGMGFAPATRMFAGTPDARFRDSCTLTVTDSSQPAATASSAVEVTGGVTPALTLPPFPSKVSLTVGTFHSEALPAASGGVEPYTYSFTCAGGALPSGMGFAPATRMFAGTPDARFRDSCTLTVTDSSQPAATASRAVEVEVTGGVTPALTLPPFPSKVSLTVGTFHSEALPAASGGVEPYTYSFTCAGGALPSGMGFAPATRMFAGTPDARFRDSCTLTVTDSSQPAATASSAVEVTGGVTPPLTLPPFPSKVSLTVGTFHSEALPAASGGVEPYTYSFTCAGGALPSGMGFAPATRMFAGTPDARFRDSCTLTVTDSSQPAATASRAVEVEVTGAATLPLTLPEKVVPGPVSDGDPINHVSLMVQQRADVTFEKASGGVRPYTYDLQCELPRGLGFSSGTRTLSGTPLEVYRGPDCTYRVTDSSSPPASVSRGFELIVDPLDLQTWRFRTRTVAGSDHPLSRTPEIQQPFVTLPHAVGRTDTTPTTPSYKLLDYHSPLEFSSATRQLSYRHTGVDPLFDTPTTFRYQVSVDDKVHDTLCVDVSYRDPPPGGGGNDGLLSTARVLVRDDAYWDGKEYRCPDAPPGSASSAHVTLSNPVHSALAPIHARRAVDVAHTAVWDRVRDWSPGAPRVLSAITPAVGIGSLSGQSGGFEYTGSSESLSVGAELGAGSWQAGLVASFTGTDLHYRAAAGLSEKGYLAGEHNTEILSLHPFAAWHMPSGGHLWASLGTGVGHLRHRDDLGFRSWSGSDVRLLAHAVGASVPLADVLSGELQAEAGIESFAFDIKGGDRISSSLPTMRGHDYRAGLAWSAPVPGAPSVSMAYKHLTGDGPEGGQLEATGSVSVEGVFDPRLTLIGNAEGSFGLGDYEQNFWRLGGGVRFAPDSLGRGFGLDLDARLMSLAGGRSAGVGLRSEAGYGLWGGPFFGMMRPYVGLIRYSGDHSVRRTLGLDLRDRSNWPIKIEVHDDSSDQSLALKFSLRHRF